LFLRTLQAHAGNLDPGQGAPTPSMTTMHRKQRDRGRI
jgi:hypothetical protein